MAKITWHVSMATRFKSHKSDTGFWLFALKDTSCANFIKIGDYRFPPILEILRSLQRSHFKFWQTYSQAGKMQTGTLHTQRSVGRWQQMNIVPHSRPCWTHLVMMHLIHARWKQKPSGTLSNALNAWNLGINIFNIITFIIMYFFCWMTQIWFMVLILCFWNQSAVYHTLSNVVMLFCYMIGSQGHSQGWALMHDLIWSIIT